MSRVTFYLLLTFTTFGLGLIAVSLASFSGKNVVADTGPVEADNGLATINNYNYSVPLQPTQSTANTISDNEDSKPFCRNPNLLRIWNAIRTDRESGERLEESSDIQDCSQMFEIRRVDLNHDGKAEILVRGKTTPLCGGVGNCMFWVLGKQRKNLRLFLVNTDYVDRSVMGRQTLKSSTNGYRDLLTTGHIIAGETAFNYWKFDGQKYNVSKRIYEVFDKEVNGKPTWKYVSAKNYRSRLYD